MSYGQRWTFGTFEIGQCIVGLYVFILYAMFHLDVGYDNDDV